MKKIGLLVACEMDSVLAHYKGIEKLDCAAGYDLYQWNGDNYTMYVLQCGIGEIAAAAGTQYLISVCGAELIVNFGVVGGLTQEMGLCSACVVERVVHYKFDLSEGPYSLNPAQIPGYDGAYLYPDKSLIEKAIAAEPSLKPVTDASGDKFVGSAEEKAYLHEHWDADICEMEAAAVVLVCNQNRVPCLMLKAVSDSLFGGADEFAVAFEKAGLACIEIADKVIKTL